MFVYSDLYEGTRMARVTDLSGIRTIIEPLEASGTLVRRTDEEVCGLPFIKFILVLLILTLEAGRTNRSLLVPVFMKSSTGLNIDAVFCLILTAACILGFIYCCGERGPDYCLCCSLSFLRGEMWRGCCYCCFPRMPWRRAGR